MIPKKNIIELKNHYFQCLFDDVIPWWEKNSIDEVDGGFLTRLERDGTMYSGDKDMWMTGREIWMFAHLYNNFKKEERWRKYALHGLNFMRKYAFQVNGNMYFRLSKTGKPLAKVLSIFTEVFASIAVAECAKMLDDNSLNEFAFKMYNFLLPRLNENTDTPMLSYPLLNTEIHLHSYDMCAITVANVFNEIWPSQRHEDDITNAINSIITKHWKPDKKYFLENVTPDGTEMFDIPEGRLVIPGHAIESAWMIMEIAQKRNDDIMFNIAVDIVLATLELGWDKEYGGIRYMTNVDMTPCNALEADLKLWWPHSEALYALLFAWAYTGKEDLMKWYYKLHEYSFSNFPDPSYGEWFGYLNRDGSKVWTAKANGWKGMFHLPRVLFRNYQLLDKLEKNNT